jgi:hypothetical protein
MKLLDDLDKQRRPSVNVNPEPLWHPRGSASTASCA